MATAKIRSIFSQAGCEIVSKPYLVTDKLAALSLQASKDFVSSLDQKRFENPVVVEILNGGRHYYMPAAVEAVTGNKPRIMSLHAKRYLDDATKEWKVRTYDREGSFSGGTIIIGDTVATGTTLAGVLNLFVDELLEAKEALPDIYVFAIAGSDFGQKLLDKVAVKLATQNKELHLVCGNCVFELHDNGTDLLFGDINSAENKARYNDEAYTLLSQSIGPLWTYPELKCAVWDWGDRFTKPKVHLEEFLEHAEHRLVANNGSNEVKTMLAGLVEETKASLAALK